MKRGKDSFKSQHNCLEHLQFMYQLCNGDICFRCRKCYNLFFEKENGMIYPKIDFQVKNRKEAKTR